MACACNKNRSTGIDARRAASQPVMPAAAPAAKAPAPVQQTSPTRTTPIMQGATQSFAMQAGGKTASFGSALERDAAVARTGGRVV